MSFEAPLREAVDLEPQPESAGAGRRFVRVTLTSWACPRETIEQAVQVAAELITNAILHAGTPLSLEVRFTEPLARVSVRDYSPVIAAMRAHGPDAMTGHGLALVAAISQDWGVEQLPDGKVVWAEVNGEAQRASALTDGSSQVPDAPRPIKFVAIPVLDFLAMAAHHEAVLREVELAWLDAHSTEGARVPGEPPALPQLARRLAGPRDLVRRAVEKAAAGGRARADLVVYLNETQLRGLRDWSRAMEDAEELCRSGQVLAPPASPEIVRLRRSLLEFVERQLASEPGPVLASTEAVSDVEDDDPTDERLRQVGHVQLGLALEATGMGAWDIDLATSEIRWTRTLDELLGYSSPPVSTATTPLLDAVHPDDRALVWAAVESARQTGEPREQDFRVLGPDGTLRWMLVKIRLRRSVDGTPTHLVGVLLDVTERRQVEESLRLERTSAQSIARRLARLQAATARLSDVRALDDVARTILAEMTQSLGADHGGLWILAHDGKTMELIGSSNYPAATAAYLRRFSLEADLPATEALRTGQPFETRAGPASYLPPEARDPEEVADAELSYTLPLRIEGRPLGLLSLSWNAPPVLDDEERRFILALADQCALALDRARLYEAERRAERRQQFLAEASRELAASLDFTTTVERLAHLLVPELADACSVMVAEPDGLKAVAHAHVDPVREDLLRRISERPDATAITHLTRVVRTGQAILNAAIDPAMLDAAALDDEHLEQLRALDIRSAMAVPMQARGNTVGLLALHMTDTGRQVRPEDVEALLDLADRAAVAIDNARTYELRSQVAETLQRSLLPGHLPAIPGAQLAARYDPAQAGVEVGGDFYDVFEAEGDWAVALGDVRGKGAAAAALTAMVRYSLRALAIGLRQPSAILARLNEAILRQRQDEEQFCSVVYARLVKTAGGIRATVSSAGHPLPLVVRADGTVGRLGAPGGLLGLFPEIPLVEDSTQLKGGDALVLYTDGVTEAHRGRQLFGEDRLSELLAAQAGSDAETFADAIQKAVHDFTEGPRRDDVAVLVLSVGT